MRNFFDLSGCLIYADKSRDEYTINKKGSLDEFLYQIYMLAHDFDGLNMSNCVKALNVAYYLAVAIYNTPHVEEENKMNAKIQNAARRELAREHNGVLREVSPADIILVRWMSWIILKLQRTKPSGMDKFLEKYKQDISWNDDVCDDEDSEILGQCSFIGNIDDLLKDRGDLLYSSDLAPNPIKATLISDSIWTNEIFKFKPKEMGQLLSFYRSIDDQLELLEWTEKKDVTKNLFIYPILKDKILEGCYLAQNKAVCNPVLPEPNNNDEAGYHEKCQQALDLYQGKINALLAQLASEREKQKSFEALIESSTQTQNFNTLLEDKYDKLLKKSKEDADSNKKAIKTLQELSDKVLEENKRLKAESDKWQSIADEKMDEMFASFRSDEEIEEMRKEEEDMMEWQNSISKSIKEVVKFCVNYTSNIDDVADSHVEAIKDMLEGLLRSSLAEELLDSDKLELANSLYLVKQNRKQQVKARNREAKEKEENRGTTNNNYFAPIGQQVSSAQTVKMEKETK